MSNYLKLFETHSEYQTYIGGQDALRPNVSYCEDNNEIHYNPIETRIVATFNVTNIYMSTDVLANTSYFDEVEIDGIVQNNIQYSYTIDTVGEHIVKYVLKDDTIIGDSAFRSIRSMISVTIPNNVTSIDNNAFNGCDGFINIIIPNSVTNIGYSAFYGCGGLTSVTIKATTPPTLGQIAFDNTNNCPIYVPAESVNAYKAANGWTTYSSRIQAIPTA